MREQESGQRKVRPRWMTESTPVPPGDAGRGTSRGEGRADAGREPTPDEEEAADRNEPDEESPSTTRDD